jgi:hypothetical protein
VYRFSLFPHVPPYIRILPPGESYSPALPPVKRAFCARKIGIDSRDTVDRYFEAFTSKYFLNVG